MPFGAQILVLRHYVFDAEPRSVNLLVAVVFEPVEQEVSRAGHVVDVACFQSQPKLVIGRETTGVTLAGERNLEAKERLALLDAVCE